MQSRVYTMPSVLFRNSSFAFKVIHTKTTHFVFRHAPKMSFSRCYNKLSVGYFELKLHRHILGTLKTNITSCKKCPLNGYWNISRLHFCIKKIWILILLLLYIFLLLQSGSFDWMSIYLKFLYATHFHLVMFWVRVALQTWLYSLSC